MWFLYFYQLFSSKWATSLFTDDASALGLRAVIQKYQNGAQEQCNVENAIKTSFAIF